MKDKFSDVRKQTAKDYDPWEKENTRDEPQVCPGYFLVCGAEWGARGEQQSGWAEEVEIGIWGCQGREDLLVRMPEKRELHKEGS